jgi:hypothetical protein
MSARNNSVSQKGKNRKRAYGLVPDLPDQRDLRWKT